MLKIFVVIFPKLFSMFHFVVGYYFYRIDIEKAIFHILVAILFCQFLNQTEK